MLLRVVFAVLVVLASEAVAHPVEEGRRRELRIDAGFHGDLPAPTIDHGGHVWDESLGILQSRTGPVFDAASGGGVAPPWRSAGEPLGVASVMMAGRSRDQSEPRFAVYDRQRMELVVWQGDDPSVPPIHRYGFARAWGDGVVPDALRGTGWERSSTTHRPVSGTMLPGLLLVLLERSDWPDGPGGVEWVSGLTIAAWQESRGGVWELTEVQDVPNDAPPEARDFRRGYLSSMAAYYPTTRGDDFTTAFVPFVDYLNHLPDRKAVGGQCGLLRVERGGVGDAWTIGPAVEIEATWGDVGEHYHAAGWTEEGVVLSIGDAHLNRVALIRCADWARYDDPSNWTVEPEWFGRSAEGDPVLVNQFWTCCAGNHDAALLVGGDNVSGSLYELTVPTAGDPEPPRFTRLLGEQPSTLLGGDLATTVRSLHRARPETNGPVVALWAFESPGFPEFSRVIYSPDGIGFSAVARLPRDFERLSQPVLVGDRLHLHRQAASGVSGFRVAAPPCGVATSRGLLVRPGGPDLLRDESGAHRPPDTMVAGPGITVERVAPGSEPWGEGWNGAPDAVCYRVRGRSEGATGRLLTLGIDDPRNPTGTLPSTAVGLHMRICNLVPSKLFLEASVNRGSASNTKRIHIASSGDWNDCDAWSNLASLPADCSVTLDNRGAPDQPFVDFLVVFRSLTIDSTPPSWMVDPVPGREVPGDKVDFPLPIRTDDWSVEVELQFPGEGGDLSIGSRLPIMPLCTWRLQGGGHVTLLHRFQSGEFRVEIGGSAIAVPTIPGYDVVRGDTVVAKLSARAGRWFLSVRSAGSIDEVIDEIELPIAHGRPPVGLRIGGPAHELVSALVVRRILVITPEDEGGLVRPEPRDPPTAVGGGEWRRSATAGPRRIPDPVGIVLMLGADGPGLSPDVDLDGDGSVTVLDLHAAIEILGDGTPTPPRSPARDR